MSLNCFIFLKIKIMNIKNYLQNGYYAKNCPKSFLSRFEKFKNTPKNIETVRLIIGLVLDIFSQGRDYVSTTTNLNLSRFVPISFIIKKRLYTCGSISFACAVTLRYANFPVKLVDGKKFTREKWRSHAWLEVYIEQEKKFIPFDPFSPLPDFGIDKNYRRIKCYIDWHDMEKGTKNK